MVHLYFMYFYFDALVSNYVLVPLWRFCDFLKTVPACLQLTNIWSNSELVRSGLDHSHCLDFIAGSHHELVPVQDTGSARRMACSSEVHPTTVYFHPRKEVGGNFRSCTYLLYEKDCCMEGGAVNDTYYIIEERPT